MDHTVFVTAYRLNIHLYSSEW